MTPKGNAIPIALDIEAVKQIVADRCRVTVEEINSKRRPQRIAHARMIAMALCYKFSGYSAECIAFAFQKKDHGTVLHAFHAVNGWSETNATFATQLGGITRRVINEAMGDTCV